MVSADPTTYEARRRALWPEVVRTLGALYGGRPDLEAVLASVERVTREAYDERPEPLRALDETRLVSPDWFQRPDRLGYVCYTDRFAGTLRDVPERLDHLEDLGVTFLHLMPLLEPRPGPNDGGYAVADYRAVDPRLGTMADLRALADELRGRGMSLVVDLVCNHTAREHPWARRAAAGDPTYQAYYLMYPDRTEPDAWERTLPEVFPDLAPGSFTWVPEAQRWVWTTFHDYQWDLDYTNPDVFTEMLAVMCHLANQGVEVLRLDAVAFLWKRLGTNCQNQPEVHLLLQAFRALLRIAAPATIFLAEAIVAPEDLVDYLGRGEGAGQECELAYHNVLMVSLWSALAEQNATLLTRTLQAMPAIPSTAAWLTYVRLHDDIGWAVTDENAAAAGLGGAAHRSFLTDFYTGDFPGSFARGEVFGENPHTGDRRVSGMLAALAGLDAARASGEPGDVDRAIRRILLLQGLALSFGGVPLIYMGDEIGLGNDPSYLDHPDLADDSRWLHRPRMDWNLARHRHDPERVEGRIFTGLRRMVAIRSRTPALHAQNQVEVLGADNRQVFAMLRSGPRGRLLVLANVGPHPTGLDLRLEWLLDDAHRPDDRPHGWTVPRVTDLLTGETLGPGPVPLAPYQVRWITTDA